MPFANNDENDAAISETFRYEVALAEKILAYPLLSAVSGVLPDEQTIRTILNCWLRAFDLDTTSVEDEHILVLLQALYDYLDSLISTGRGRLLGEETDSVHITHDILLL